MKITYRFALESGQTKEFELNLDPATLALEGPFQDPPPEWTRLDNQKCPNCPLSSAQSPHCPAARGMATVIEVFKDSVSFHEADVSVTTPGREYRKRVPLQNGISSLIGLVMVTSGCPVLEYLRPMAATHLPFSNLAETMYRAISMYLFAQYFRRKRGAPSDWDLKDLVKIYDEVSEVNRALVGRLRQIKLQDASLNALVSLDCFATVSVMSIMDDALQETEALFTAYLKKD